MLEKSGKIESLMKRIKEERIKRASGRYSYDDNNESNRFTDGSKEPDFPLLNKKKVDNVKGIDKQQQGDIQDFENRKILCKQYGKWYL